MLQGHLHTDGLIHIVGETDVGWLAPEYAYISFCGAIRSGTFTDPGNYIRTPSGHTLAEATCLRCIAEENREHVQGR